MKTILSIFNIGDYDVWRFEFGDSTKYFHLGLMTKDIRPWSSDWHDMSSEATIADIRKSGEIIAKFNNIRNSSARKRFGYVAEFEGMKCYILNTCHKGSDQASDELDIYDAVVVFCHDGEHYEASIYSEKHDVSKIAEKYGGGGHKGAAGFRFDTIPWSKK